MAVALAIIIFTICYWAVTDPDVVVIDGRRGI